MFFFGLSAADVAAVSTIGALNTLSRRWANVNSQHADFELILALIAAATAAPVEDVAAAKAATAAAAAAIVAVLAVALLAVVGFTHV